MFQAAKQLGYVHKAARKAAKKSEEVNSEKTIAIIIDDVTNPFYSYMINEIRKGLHRYGHHLITISNAENREQMCIRDSSNAHSSNSKRRSKISSTSYGVNSVTKVPREA